MKSLRLSVLSAFALFCACGDDEGGGGGSASACKPFLEQAKTCDAVVVCEDEVEAKCLQKYPKAVCSDGSAFDSYLACLASSSSK